VNTDGLRESTRVEYAPPTWEREQPWRITRNAIWLQKLLGITREDAVGMSKMWLDDFQSLRQMGGDASDTFPGRDTIEDYLAPYIEGTMDEDRAKKALTSMYSLYKTSKRTAV